MADEKADSGFGAGKIVGFADELKKWAEAISAAAAAIDAATNAYDKNATRSAVIEINNTTSLPLTLSGFDHDWGDFGKSPEMTIAPRSSAVFSSRSGGLFTGAQGNVQYRIGDDGTVFHVDWVIPMSGDNECSCRAEHGANGAGHPERFGWLALPAGGNTNVHLRFLIGEQFLAASRQAGWLTCGKCKTLVFAPQNAQSMCTHDGGRHDPVGKPNGLQFEVPHDLEGYNHESNWRSCLKCKTMFFNGGHEKGACPAPGPRTHVGAGLAFHVPVGQAEDEQYPHQGGWRCCRKCLGLYLVDELATDDPRISDELQSRRGRWDAGPQAESKHRRSSVFGKPVSGSLTQRADTSGAAAETVVDAIRDALGGQFGSVIVRENYCGAGGVHVPFDSQIYFLPYQRPEDATHQKRWQRCYKCQVLFFVPHNLEGTCPRDNGKHAAIPPADGGKVLLSGGLNFSMPHTEPAPLHEPGWMTCRKCKIMYFADFDFQGVCSAPGLASHEAAGFNFQIAHDQGPGQRDWRRCFKCLGLFFQPHNGPGTCPADQGAHETEFDRNYRLEPEP